MQIPWLFILAIPIACISWTVTFEEIFREPREYCVKRSAQSQQGSLNEEGNHLNRISSIDSLARKVIN